MRNLMSVLMRVLYPLMILVSVVLLHVSSMLHLHN